MAAPITVRSAHRTIYDAVHDKVSGTKSELMHFVDELLAKTMTPQARITDLTKKCDNCKKVVDNEMLESLGHLLPVTGKTRGERRKRSCVIVAVALLEVRAAQTRVDAAYYQNAVEEVEPSQVTVSPSASGARRTASAAVSGGRSARRTTSEARTVTVPAPSRRAPAPSREAPVEEEGSTSEARTVTVPAPSRRAPAPSREAPVEEEGSASEYDEVAAEEVHALPLPPAPAVAPAPVRARAPARAPARANPLPTGWVMVEGETMPSDLRQHFDGDECPVDVDSAIELIKTRWATINAACSGMDVHPDAILRKTKSDGTANMTLQWIHMGTTLIHCW
jgi:hypothetical protein